MVKDSSPFAVMVICPPTQTSVFCLHSSKHHIKEAKWSRQTKKKNGSLYSWLAPVCMLYG